MLLLIKGVKGETMNNISEQLLQAMDIIAEEKISNLEFDKTIKAVVYSLVNLDGGEYKVRYNGNIFSAYSDDLTQAYKVDDEVYVTVPEGNFSNKKLITGLVSAKSLSYSQLMALQNAIFELSPTFDMLYGGSLYDASKSYGVIAGKPYGSAGSYNYIYKGPDKFQSNGYHGLFQQYANQYELIRVQASFLTQFQNEHEKGNYGLEIEFYAKSLEGYEVVSYILDLNAFNGDPYHLSVYSPQSVIIKAQKNYLLGLKSIKLFEKEFEYDRIIENGLLTDKKNTTNPNIFVKDISLQYVDQKDLTDTNYYLMISAPKGIAFTSNISSLDLVGRLVYQGKDIMDEKTCKNQWFVRDLTVMIGDEDYNKDVGFGWRPLKNTSNLLSLVAKDVGHEQRYKLLTTYNETVSLSAEIELFNHNNNYDYVLEQHTNNADISLQIVNNLENGELVGDWYLSYPDGAYLELNNGKKKNSVSVSQYLKYSSVTFYCQIYNLAKTMIIGTLEHTIVNSESSEDVTISYTGEDTFRYDANGDIAIEDTEKERTLQVNLAWKEGFGTAYSVTWLARDLLGKEIPLTGEEFRPEQSMIDKLWVDNANILHYNIKQKYKVNFNNNTLVVKIRTVTEEEYRFDKEILFLKDGDQGTNGTTYVLAVRPCDNSGLKLSGFRPLVYNNGWRNTLPLRCYVYKDGELINLNTKNYTIKYKWSGINITFAEASSTDKVTARGSGNLSSSSVTAASQNLQFYVKVQVDIDDKMNGRKTSIYASYPIDVAVGGINTSLVNIDTIPSYIKYTASGIVPKFYSNDINFIYNKQKLNNNITPLNKKILDIEETDGLYYLKPATNFIFENIKENNESNIGLLKLTYTNTQYIVHPIIMYLDTYGNEAINGWDGTALDTGDGKYVFAPQIGAGEKDSQNRFTGVVMGKDSIQDKIGLYGYQAGLNTFGLMQDGRAYFGAKAGGGQIVLDGRYATIFGGDVTLNGPGRPVAAANGMYLTLADRNNGPNVSDRVTASTKAIGIGLSTHKNEYGNNVKEENFYVTYDGKLRATEANIQGNIYANKGQIGGTARQGGWTIELNRLYSGSGNNHVELNSDTSKSFAIWAGRNEGGSTYTTDSQGIGSITNPAPFVVTRDGFLYARNARIEGNITAKTLTANTSGSIAGWTISNNSLSKGDVGMASSGTNTFWAGDNFSVTRSGKLTCKNADVTGKVTAEELYASERGTIAGWTINSTYLSGGQMQINSDGSLSGPGWSINSGGDASFNNITANKVWSFGSGNNTWSSKNGFSFHSGDLGNNNLITPGNGLAFGFGSISLGSPSLDRQSTGISVGQDGKSLVIAGDIRANNGYFHGTVYATDGRFAGEISYDDGEAGMKRDSAGWAYIYGNNGIRFHSGKQFTFTSDGVGAGFFCDVGFNGNIWLGGSLYAGQYPNTNAQGQNETVKLEDVTLVFRKGILVEVR